MLTASRGLSATSIFPGPQKAKQAAIAGSLLHFQNVRDC
jgi:hypothetical protein